MRGFKFRYWIIPLLLFVGSLLVFRSGVFSNGQAQSQVVDSTIKVKVTQAQYTDTTPTLLLNGTIEGKTSANISAKLAGRIEEVLVQEGQAVKAGDPLVKLESNELANAVRTAQDAVNKAQINVDLALADYNRYNKLNTIGAVSQQQFETAEAKLKSAQADLSSARTSKENAEQQYGYCQLIAPVDGVVANNAATIGQVVSPGVALMMVEDIRQVYAVVNIEQKDLGRIKVGQKATVVVDAYPDKTFDGVIDIINPEAGTTNRMFRTKVRVENAEGALRPGMFTKVQLSVGAAVQVLTVPQAAVIQKQGLYSIFVLENNKAVRRQVEIGDVTGEMIQVKSGLQAGEKIIISNVNQLKDGQSVRTAE
jgi:membrane fusion protein (multidrug efflux system)